jgi:hypothetical protein
MKLINPVETQSGAPRSFYTYNIPFRRLCRCIASCPGVEFTSRPGFVLPAENVVAEFRFKGHDFKIESVWADIHVSPRDDVSAYPEIVEIENYVEQHGHSPLGLWIKRVCNKRR